MTLVHRKRKIQPKNRNNRTRSQLQDDKKVEKRRGSGSCLASRTWTLEDGQLCQNMQRVYNKEKRSAGTNRSCMKDSLHRDGKLKCNWQSTAFLKLPKRGESVNNQKQSPDISRACMCYRVSRHISRKYFELWQDKCVVRWLSSQWSTLWMC